jgi:hypothetical protein
MKLSKPAQWFLFLILSPCLLIFVSTWTQLHIFRGPVFISFISSIDPQIASLLSSLWLWGIIIDLATLIMISVEIHVKGKSNFPSPLGFICYLVYGLSDPSLLFFSFEVNSIEIISLLKVMEFLLMTLFSSLILLLPKIILLFFEKIGYYLDRLGLKKIAKLISSRIVNK